MKSKKKKEHIIKRRAKVIKRKIKRFKVKKTKSWLKTNIKGHPIILGFLFFIWVSHFLRQVFSHNWTPKNFLFFNLSIIFIWFILILIANLLKDIRPTKWYYRKKFVFWMLLLFPPVGIIFLWLGSRFKRVTKIIFTLIFGVLFLISYIYPTLRYEKFMKKTAIERISDIITHPKKRIFLKRADADILNNLKLRQIRRRKKFQLDPTEIASRYAPSVVSIKTKDKVNRDLGMGSGFIISEDGIILTNFHVLQGAHFAEVKFKDIIFENSMLIKGISYLDIALIKIEAKGLPVLPVGNSDNLETGEAIVAIGNPWGLERSVSNGLVSAVREKDNIKLIQMTAPVSLGSSGGPVINSYGEVVGITTLASFFGAQNLNFAIPINYLKRLINTNK